MKRPYYRLRWIIVVVALVLFAPPRARAENIIDEWR